MPAASLKVVSCAPQSPPFGRVLTAMATPFDAEGRVDLDGAARLAKALAASGSEALVVTGSTGEAPTLEDSERDELWRAVIESISIPVLAGSTSNDTAHSVVLTRRAEAAGAAGILAVTPYYNRPPQSGLKAHFSAIAGATSLPVILYDIPIRTGRKIASSTILALAHEVANIIGLKDAAGDAPATARLLAEAPAGFACYAGDDGMTLPLLSIGAVGLIGVATHWAGQEFAEMIDAFLAGDLATAQQLQRALLASIAFESSDDAPNPMPVKVMLGVMGLPGGPCRLPLGEGPADLAARAQAVLAELDVWREQRGNRG